MSTLNESHVEEAALTSFGELGYAVGHGPQLSPGEPAAERDSFGEVVLVGCMREVIRRLNPAVPEGASACAPQADGRATVKRYLKVRSEGSTP